MTIEAKVELSSRIEAALNASTERRMSYDEQLRDPRWFDFRREILEQRNFCESCKRSGVKLQLHHNFYDRNKLAWEYHSSELKVLCRACHEAFTMELLSFRRDVLPSLNVPAIRAINAALSVGIKYNDPLVVAYALGYVVSNPEQAKRFAMQFSK